MSEESIAAMKKAAEEGPAFMEAQRKHVQEVADREAARRAALPVEPLPKGFFKTKDEAIVYVNQQREAGRFPQQLWDDNPNAGAFVWKISSPFNGYQEVWATAVSDYKDPAFPQEG
jgi:Xaa-Pro aminopeptidase